MPLRVGSIDVIQTSLRPCAQDPNYDNGDSSITILPKGHRKDPAYAAFQANTIFEKDVKIPLRDGARIRADIFRPADSKEKVPALVAWSPYGKSGRGTSSHYFPKHCFPRTCFATWSQEDMFISKERCRLTARTTPALSTHAYFYNFFSFRPKQ